MGETTGLSFTARDVDTIYDGLKAFVIETRPLVWSDFFESNLGQALMKMTALVGDMVSQGQDAVAAEIFLATCQRYESALRFCRSVGYTPQSASPAEVLVTSGALPSILETNGGTVPVGSVILSGDMRYELLEEATISAGSTISRLSLFEGETFEETFDPTDQTKQEIVSANGVVAEASWTVYVGTTSNPDNLWTQVDKVALEASPTQTYEVSFDASGRLYVLFGDGAAGKIPDDTITLGYRTTNGAEGESPILSIRGSVKVNVTGGLGTVDVTYENSEGAASGGADRESLAELKSNVPTYLRSQDKVLSLLDYNTSILRVPGIALAFSDALVASYSSNILEVHVWDDEEVTFTSETYDLTQSTALAYTRYLQMPLTRANDVQAYLKTRSPWNVLNAILRPTIAHVDVYLGDVFYNTRYTPAAMHESVTQAVIDAFEDADGFSVRLAKLYDAIRSVTGVERFYVDRIVFTYLGRTAATGSVELTGQPSDGDTITIGDGATVRTKTVSGSPVKDNGTSTVTIVGGGMTTDEHAGRLCTFQTSGNGYVVVSNTATDVIVTGDASVEAADQDVVLTSAATFEFDDDNSITAGNVEVDIGVDSTATMANLRYAINVNLAIGAVNVAGASNPTITLTNETPGADGNATTAKSGANITVTGMSGGDDAAVEKIEDYRRIQDPGDADRWPAGTYDPNTPATGYVEFTLSVNPTDGEVVVIGDGVDTVTFEFDDNASVTGDNVAVTIGGNTAATLANLKTAVEANLGITGTVVDPRLSLENDTPGSAGNVTITTTGANVVVNGMVGGGEEGAYFRDGGQTPYLPLQDIVVRSAFGSLRYYDETYQYNNEIYYNAGVSEASLVQAVNLRRLIMDLVPVAE